MPSDLKSRIYYFGRSQITLIAIVRIKIVLINGDQCCFAIF